MKTFQMMDSIWTATISNLRTISNLKIFPVGTQHRKRSDLHHSTHWTTDSCITSIDRPPDPDHPPDPDCHPDPKRKLSQTTKMDDTCRLLIVPSSLIVRFLKTAICRPQQPQRLSPNTRLRVSKTALHQTTIVHQANRGGSTTVRVPQLLISKLTAPFARSGEDPKAPLIRSSNVLVPHSVQHHSCSR